jgi:hypothetical protein
MIAFFRKSFNIYLSLFLLSACAVEKDFYSVEKDQQIVIPHQDVYHTIYFLGGSDEVTLGSSDLDLTLTIQIDESGKESTLLLLGNNSLRHTSLKSDSSQKALERRELLTQRYNFFNNLKSKYYAVLGPHEWANGSRRGMENARILEEIIEEEMTQENIIHPASGCPGPDEIPIGEDIVLLLIDTQWLFHSWDKPKSEDGCSVESSLDFYVNLDDAIKRNYDKKIIVAGYHGLESNGPHGGYFPVKSHFTPIPVIGSIDLGMRKWMGNPSDLTNPFYESFIKSMKDILNEHQNIIYLSAHEKTLEHHESGNIHILNSGSYSKGDPVGQKDAVFASGKRGYGRLLFNQDGKCVVEYWGLREEKMTLLYQKMLFSGSSRENAEEISDITSIDFSDSTKTSYASNQYNKKQKRPGMMGNNYREEWVTEVSDIPYFDIGHEKGGMKILKRGGGQQTKSLRLESKDELQYVLRSIEKYPESAVPAELRNTVAVDVVTDQISAAYPYGAFAIPKMADAAGIYHTNPKLVYLPDDPRLGIYRLTFGDGLYLYEERPAKNREDIESFGRSKDIVNTPEVLKKTRSDGDHYVDQEFTLRSRLFDMMIGDWDRHDDQWRWASFTDENDFKYYRPIPRDRDQAFFWSDGWLLKIASYNWGLAKFQGFHDEIKDVDGVNFNGRYFDRSFINEPPKETWIQIAKELQASVTDDVIENSIKDLPKEIYDLKGEIIIRKLKNRRNDLLKYAEEYYLFISKIVNVLGSDKNEHFIIDRIDDKKTKVTVNLLKTQSGEVKRKMFERTFLESETEEIRIYGFSGDDVFDFIGEGKSSINVRIIGGRGDDTVNENIDSQNHHSLTYFYDTKSGTKINGKLKDKTSDRDPLINDYNRKMFQYNAFTPLIYPWYNPDDGLIIGLGVLFKTHGFRKYPFKEKHALYIELAPKSKSYDFSYKGTFSQAIGKWDFVINADISTPSHTDYFYGYGNESIFDQEKFDVDSRYYSARYVQYIFYPEITRKSKNELHQFTIGGGYQSANVKSELNSFNNEQERFIISYNNTLDFSILDIHRHYLALYGEYTFDNTNNEYMPLQGIKWNLFLTGLEDVDRKDKDIDFQRVRTDFSYYFTVGKFLKTTLALRAGGIMTNGDYEFYHAAKIGGTNTFRGVRKYRLTGQHSFYQNTDLRIKLFNLKNSVMPTTVGLVFFHDFGRVWYPDDESSKMHRAYGGGIWLAPLNAISFGLDYSWSTLGESALFLRMGFLF